MADKPPASRGPSATPAYLAYLAALVAVSIVVVPLGARLALDAPWTTALWVFFIAISNLLTIPILPKMDIDASVGAPVMVAASVVLAPPLAFFVNLIGFTNERELRGKATWTAVVFNRAQAGVCAGAASFAAHALPAELLPTMGTAAVRTVIAVVTFNVINTAAVTLFLWTHGRLGLARAAKDTAAPFPRFAVDFGFVGLLALLIVIAFEAAGPWAVVLLAMPLWLGYSALSSARESEDRAEELAVRVKELETLNGLGSELLAARLYRQVASTTEAALRATFDSQEIKVSLTGDISEDLTLVRIRGAEPAAIGVPADLGERSAAVVEAIAGLAGMALQRLELEEELAENEKALSRLSAQILEEGTQERSRIALEIHDDVLPFLAAAEIQADNVRSALAREDAGRADKLAMATHDAVHGGIARLREVLDALQRQIIVPGGLRPGLESALAELRIREGLDANLTAPDPMPKLPLAVEILALETVRGCLANVAKHAQATTVQVRVERLDGILRLEVRDDGVGFDPNAVGAGHHGLVLMAQRVELARGRFIIDSAPDQGTRVHLEVPV